MPTSTKLGTSVKLPNRRRTREKADESGSDRGYSSDPDVETVAEKLPAVKEGEEELEQQDETEIRVPAELRGHTVVPQEYEAYMAANSSRHRVSGKVDLANDIDEIDGRLVAKLDVKKLFNRIRASPFRQQKNFETAMDILEGTSLSFLFANNKEQAEARIKKGIQETPKPIQPMVSAALRHLMRSARFLIGTRFPTRYLKGASPITHCGAFFVKKSNLKLRVILDGRYANVFFRPEAASFAFFKLETLRNVIGNLSENKEWHALNYDLRHWFHQIPLPHMFCKYLGMQLTDRKKKKKGLGRGRRYWAFPRSLPMGFILAPFLAQNCAWAIVLSQEQGGDWNGSDLDMHYLNRIKNQKTPPSWVPLKGGGGIFVFLDNILVVTPDRKVADWWEEKIIRDCKELHAWLKSDNPEHDPNASVEQQKKTLSGCRVNLSKNSNNSFDFLGVRWTHNGRSVILKSTLDSDQLPGLDNTGILPYWKGSRRDMAGILGKILWYRRVHGITYFDSESSMETRAILSLYRKLSPEVDLVSRVQPRVAWNEDFTDFTGDDLDGLIQAWNKRARGTVTYAQVQRTKVGPEEVIFSITDAATAEDTEGQSCAGGCWYPAGKNCFESEPLVASPSADSGRPEHDKVLETSFTVPFNEADGIAVGEMLAITATVERLLRARRSHSTKIIVLATDNLSCKYWIEKGHSRSETIQRLLRELHSMLEQAGSRLYVTYVNTKVNFADEISRNRATVPSKLQDNHDLLLRALAEATSSLWLVSGGTVGGDEFRHNKNDQ